MSFLDTKKRITNFLNQETVNTEELLKNLQNLDSKSFNYSMKILALNLDKFNEKTLNQLLNWILVSKELIFYSIPIFFALEKSNKLESEVRIKFVSEINNLILTNNIEKEQIIDVLNFLRLKAQIGDLPLLEYFISNNEEEIIKIYIIKCLAKIKREGIRNLVLTFLDDSENVRIEALKALIINFEVGNFEIIEEYFKKGSDQLRSLILDSFKIYPTPNSDKILINALKFKTIRNKAIDVLNHNYKDQAIQEIINELNKILLIFKKNKEEKSNKLYDMKYLFKLVNLSSKYQNNKLKNLFFEFLEYENFPYLHITLEGILLNTNFLTEKEISTILNLAIKNTKLIDFTINLIGSIQTNFELDNLVDLLNVYSDEYNQNKIFKSIFKNNKIFTPDILKSISERCSPILSDFTLNEINKRLKSNQKGLKRFLL